MQEQQDLQASCNWHLESSLWALAPEQRPPRRAEPCYDAGIAGHNMSVRTPLLTPRSLQVPPSVYCSPLQSDLLLQQVLHGAAMVSICLQKQSQIINVKSKPQQNTLEGGRTIA